MVDLYEAYLTAKRNWRTLLIESELVFLGEKEFNHELFLDTMQRSYAVFHSIGINKKLPMKRPKNEFLVERTITLECYSMLLNIISEYAGNLYSYLEGSLEFCASQLAARTLLDYPLYKQFKFPEGYVLSNALLYGNKSFDFSYDLESGDLSNIMDALSSYRKTVIKEECREDPRRIIPADEFLAELKFAVQQMDIADSWYNLCDHASMTKIMNPEDPVGYFNEKYDRDAFEKLAASTYDLFAPFAYGKEIPKALLGTYSYVRTFARNRFIQSCGKGELQFRTAIAAALCELLEERVELPEDEKIIIFHLDEQQTAAEPGYYTYNLETFLYNYIGKELPL